MGVFSWLRRRSQPSEDGRSRPHSEEESEEAQIKRITKAIRKERLGFLEDRLEHLKQIRLEEQMNNEIEATEDALEGPESDESGAGKDPTQNPETLLLGLLARAFGSSLTPQATTPQENISPLSGEGGKKIWTEAELRAIKAKIPAAYLLIAKKMSDEELIEELRVRYPDIFMQASEDSIIRALAILRE